MLLLFSKIRESKRRIFWDPCYLEAQRRVENVTTIPIKVEEFELFFFFFSFDQLPQAPTLKHCLHSI